MAQIRKMVKGATYPALKVKLEEQSENGDWIAVQGLTGATVKFSMIERATYVDAVSAKTQKILCVDSTEDIEVGDKLIIGIGMKRQEVGEVASITAGESVTLVADLTFAHSEDDADEIAVLKIDEADGVLDDADDALVRYDWATNDLDETGMFECRFKVTRTDGTVLYQPSRDRDRLYVDTRESW